MPRLFNGAESVPGLTWPTLTFSDRLTIELGGERGDLELHYCGRGHTEGDIVAWLPSSASSTPVTWSRPRPRCTPATRSTATGLRPLWTACGVRRGDADRRTWGGEPGREAVDAAIAQTRHFLHRDDQRGRRGAGTRRHAQRSLRAHARRPDRPVRSLADLRALPAVRRPRLWDELSGIDRPGSGRPNGTARSGPQLQG